ncbi:MAG: peptide deformylase [Rhodospirillaceae bacterium]|jgi:peptide deformylase|nr:peptide deformylase [Rhodospirillaceae bacterium]
MALLPIIVAPDPRLKIETRPVEAVDDDLRAFLGDMLDTMYAADGIGLAAPQVGDERSVIVVDLTREDEERSPMKMINPEITWYSDDERVHDEGCLSLPEHYAEVVRPDAIRVTYLDETGASCELEADGMLSTCIQHEIDHLHGVLFVDHVSAIKRGMILRKLKKAKKQAAA